MILILNFIDHCKREPDFYSGSLFCPLTIGHIALTVICIKGYNQPMRIEK